MITISQLIEKLNEVKDKCGDLEVVVRDADTDWILSLTISEKNIYVSKYGVVIFASYNNIASYNNRLDVKHD